MSAIIGFMAQKMMGQGLGNMMSGGGGSSSGGIQSMLSGLAMNWLSTYNKTQE